MNSIIRHATEQQNNQVKKAQIPVSLVKAKNIFVTSDEEEVEIISVGREIEGFVTLKWKGGYALLDNQAKVYIKY